MTMSKDISEGAIIFNRASLALAKSQRLIASWLPPKAPEEAITTKTEEELDREESEAFSPIPELLGLGAQIPQDGERSSLHSRHRSSNVEDKLQQQFLGRKPSANRLKNHTIPRSLHNGSMPSKYKLHDTWALSESDDEVGRTAFLGRNITGLMDRPQPDRSEAATVQVASTAHSLKEKQKVMHTAASRKRSRSYLDEVLVERSQKRKKKKQVENTQS